jgi:uncharacterized membrane protein (DUF4010 family)
MLVPAFLILAVATIAVGWFWSRRPDAVTTQVKREYEPKNLRELLAAFLFALLFLAMVVAIQIA